MVAAGCGGTGGGGVAGAVVAGCGGRVRSWLSTGQALAGRRPLRGRPLTRCPAGAAQAAPPLRRVRRRVGRVLALVGRAVARAARPRCLLLLLAACRTGAAVLTWLRQLLQCHVHLRRVGGGGGGGWW